MHAASKLPDDHVPDVVICGAGLSGLLLARQLRRELPTLAVTLVERSTRPLPDAAHKVGESTVEAGSQYLERLGLTDYLLERHLVKLGLRFFPGGGHLPLHERLELGPVAEPLVRSYQLDRGRFETDLRGFLEDDGARLIEGARVRDIELSDDGAPHVVRFERDGELAELRARWVVDASGRAALLRSRLKLKRGARHDASAGWFRIRGRFDINDLVPAEERAWHQRPCAEERWRSTNHFMGAGYWVWVIPLATGNTSIGVVIHEELHDFARVTSLGAVRGFLHEHEPQLAAALDDAEVLDFLCLGKYSHGVARAWSPQRWAIVGEAGAFVDPLYSPGTDFIGFANCFTTELIRRDLAHEDLDVAARRLNTQYRAFVNTTTDLFRTAAPVYGQPRVMSAKVYWDNFVYWSYTCQFLKQELWKLDDAALAPFDLAARSFARNSGWMNAAFRAWAELASVELQPGMLAIPKFPSVLVDAHIATGRHMQVDETLAYVQQRARESTEIAVEIVLRLVQELGPELAEEWARRVDYATWELPVSSERLELEGRGSLARRAGMSAIARDVERNLGALRRHVDGAAARELLVAPARA